MKLIFLSLPLIFISIFCLAQAERSKPALPIINQDPFQQKIELATLANDQVQFSARLRPLRQLVGAPAAFYTYFWEFGDGTFSDNNLLERDKPKHRYKAAGSYLVRLFATNNYDNGEAPTVAQQFNIRVSTPSNAKVTSDFFGSKDRDLNIKLKVNRNPKPGENLVAYLGYRNRIGNDMAGSIVLFYNDQRLLKKSFSVTDRRTYNGEENSSLDRMLSQSGNPELMNQVNIAGNGLHPGNVALSTREAGDDHSSPFETRNTVSSLKKKYLDYSVFRFNNSSKDEEHFIFMTMQTLPGMISDTNEVISMTAMMVPDNTSIQPELYQLTMQIVASHDPNRMQLAQNRINYRFMGKKKELTYKVQFQNIGKGPARNISIGIALPRQLNAATLKINEISPKLIFCDSATYSQQSCIDTFRTADSIYLVFKNIYLPGLDQNLVKNEDSTRGFIKYTIRFKKRPKKIPFSSRAVIKFDNNKPVYTNSATAKFIKGISPGIVAGYNFSLANGNYSSKGPLQIGYVLAPFAPSRPYFQAEIYAGILQQETYTAYGKLSDSNRIKINQQINAVIKPPVELDSGRTETISTTKRNIVQLVPLHFRYNINNWFSVGVGVMGQVAISQKITTIEKDYVSGRAFNFNTIVKYDTVVTKSVDLKSAGSTKTFAEANIAPFIDLQVGRVRTGPVIGLRYYRRFSGNIPNQFFVYAGIKL